MGHLRDDYTEIVQAVQSSEPAVMPRQDCLSLLRLAIFTVLMTGTIGPGAAAPPAPDLTMNQIWMPAARIHEIKNQFVATVRQLTEAVSGTFGDEGRRITARLRAT